MQDGADDLFSFPVHVLPDLQAGAVGRDTAVGFYSYAGSQLTSRGCRSEQGNLGIALPNNLRQDIGERQNQVLLQAIVFHQHHFITAMFEECLCQWLYILANQ